MLLLDSDQPGAHASLLADAAVHANALLDHDNAARMAQAAIDGSDGRDGVQAHLALVEAVRWQGSYEAAEEVAAATAPFATSAEDRSRLAVVRALPRTLLLTGFCLGHRTPSRIERALSVLHLCGPIELIS